MLLTLCAVPLQLSASGSSSVVLLAQLSELSTEQCVLAVIPSKAARQQSNFPFTLLGANIDCVVSSFEVLPTRTELCEIKSNLLADYSCTALANAIVNLAFVISSFK